MEFIPSDTAVARASSKIKAAYKKEVANKKKKAEEAAFKASSTSKKAKSYNLKIEITILKQLTNYWRKLVSSYNNFLKISQKKGLNWSDWRIFCVGETSPW